MNRTKCAYCASTYKLKSNLNDHQAICELVHQSALAPSASASSAAAAAGADELKLPSQRELYSALLGLAKKCAALEKKVDSHQKWIGVKRKKLDALAYLNGCASPHHPSDAYLMKDIHSHLNVRANDLARLTTQSFMSVATDILARELPRLAALNQLPLVSFPHKNRVVYVYAPFDGELYFKWRELDRAELAKFMNQIQNKMLASIQSMAAELSAHPLNDDAYHKILLKALSVDCALPRNVGQFITAVYAAVQTNGIQLAAAADSGGDAAVHDDL